MKSQRVAGGGIAIWRELLNGLLRADLNRNFQVWSDGFRYRYQCGVYVGIRKVDYLSI